VWCCRWKRGYKNVIGKGIELNKAGTDTPLMMETRSTCCAVLRCAALCCAVLHPAALLSSQPNPLPGAYRSLQFFYSAR